ncbi:MAG: M20/M25/M40 family metallo-hydrolase [Firmicutes bacterium]|nr:M20/M25/M40 family metallo-hydrolase [Bacillota bacterium]
MTLLEILRTLEKKQTVSGNESAVHGTVKDILGDGFRYSADALGNFVATLESSTGKNIMLSAHADQPGFIATHIEDSGLIRAASVGNLHLNCCINSPVEFENGVKGVLSCDANGSSNDVKDAMLFCDIGAGSRRDAQKKVCVGDRFALSFRSVRLMGNKISAPGLAAKLCCAALISAAETIKADPPKHTVHFVFSAQNEAGSRGIGAAAYSLKPSCAVNLGACACGDVPGAKGTIKLSKGPAIKISDKSSICTKSMITLLNDAANAEGLSVQTEISEQTGSDTAAVLKSCGGIPTGAISIPFRYMRTPTETADIKDAETAAKLICAFVNSY